MVDGSDAWPMIVAIIGASWRTLLLIGLVVANIYIYFFKERSVKKYINVMSHMPQHTTASMVVRDALGINPTETTDFFSVIADSDTFSQRGYGEPISSQGLTMEMSLQLARVCIYTYRLVIGAWPHKGDALPSREELIELSAEKDARDASEKEAEAIAYLRKRRKSAAR